MQPSWRGLREAGHRQALCVDVTARSGLCFSQCLQCAYFITLCCHTIRKWSCAVCDSSTLNGVYVNHTLFKMDGLPSSIFVDETAPVYEMPVSAISRPIASILDESKVEQFMAEMKAGAQFTPIEVAWVEDNGNNYYFAFGGCHRWAAVKQLGLPTIRARLIKVSPSAIDTYLGASSPFRKNRPAAAATANVAADSVSTPNAAAAVDQPS